jgi:hypothetical protein
MCDPFLDAPLPDTIGSLLAECKALRKRMGERSDSLAERELALRDAPRIVARIWEAMRALGDAVPDEAKIEAPTLADHWLDDPDDKLLVYRKAIDDAIAWCRAERTASTRSTS